MAPPTFIEFICAAVLASAAIGTVGLPVSAEHGKAVVSLDGGVEGQSATPIRTMRSKTREVAGVGKGGELDSQVEGQSAPPIRTMGSKTRAVAVVGQGGEIEIQGGAAQLKVLAVLGSEPAETPMIRGTQRSTTSKKNTVVNGPVIIRQVGEIEKPIKALMGGVAELESAAASMIRNAQQLPYRKIHKWKSIILGVIMCLIVCLSILCGRFFYSVVSADPRKKTKFPRLVDSDETGGKTVAQVKRSSVGSDRPSKGAASEEEQSVVLDAQDDNASQRRSGRTASCELVPEDGELSDDEDDDDDVDEVLQLPVGGAGAVLTNTTSKSNPSNP